MAVLVYQPELSVCDNQPFCDQLILCVIGTARFGME